MKTTVKNLSDTKVQLTISLDKSDLEAAQLVATKKLASKVKVPGFRQGKAPASVAARHLDPVQLGQQTLEDALSKAVAESFLKEELQALERPEVDITTYEPGDKLEFTAEAEILPTVTLGDYKSLKVAKPKVTVPAGDVTDVLERLRQSQAEKKEVKRAAEKGDEVIIDFVGKKDGEAFDGGTAKDYPLRLGSNSFIPGFEDGIVGKKSGETFDIDLKFPDDYHAASLKGEAVTFTVTLNKVEELMLPELNDEFAAKSGPFKTLAELKDDVKRELANQREAEATDKLKDELVTKLIEASTVPVPNILLTDQIRSLEQDMTQSLAYQGRSLDQYLSDNGFESKDKWLDEDVAPVAKKRVQAGLALAELSKAENVTASTKEVDERIARYKDQYKNNPQMVAQFDQPETRQDIASRLLTEKTVDYLLNINTK
jgi:trigger factor